jgi:hypothetical protein
MQDVGWATSASRSGCGKNFIHARHPVFGLIHEIEVPTEKAAISGACLGWCISEVAGAPQPRILGQGRKPQVGPNINTAYPQPKSFFLQMQAAWFTPPKIK